MPDFSHFDEHGGSRMVDVGNKPPSDRFARASGMVTMSAETQKQILDNRFSKGNVLEISRLAGIMAAKKTSDLIPLCHPLPICGVEIVFDFPSETEISISASVNVFAKTGAEMEALSAVSTAALTLYDMCKSVDRGMVIQQIQLEEKRGGQSGHFVRPGQISSE
ncbi:MAG: cyclic pyranopterin monophosphate synthase MoaC [Planctomycetota bacterium]|nr:cyclic pyranopterin monophosphate synthase MoaC [Planctomycetota bacterium]